MQQPKGPAPLDVEATVDGRPAEVRPMPRTAEGHTDWEALAAALPAPTLAGPQLPVPEGWVWIPVAGADQTLYLAAASRYEGIMPEITLRQLPPAEGGARFEDLHAGDSSVNRLSLGVEPYVAGPWTGIHAAWSLPRFGTTVIGRQWILDGGTHGRVEIAALHAAYLAPYLAPMVDGIVGGLMTGPEGEGPGSAPSQASGQEAGEALGQRLERAIADAERAREALAAAVATPAGPVSPSAVAPRERDRIIAGFDGGPAWILRAGADRAGGEESTSGSADSAAGHGPGRTLGRLWLSGTESLLEHTPPPGRGTGVDEAVSLGRYRRDDAADMVLRTVGHRPLGPADVPVSLLPPDAFAARLHDPTVPLPPQLPPGAEVSEHLDPQTIYRWWTAPWSWWSLSHTPEEGVTEGLRVLSVASFGHYLWDAGTAADAIRLQSVDGLGLYRVLTTLLGITPSLGADPHSPHP